VKIGVGGARGPGVGGEYGLWNPDRLPPLSSAFINRKMVPAGCRGGVSNGPALRNEAIFRSGREDIRENPVSCSTPLEVEGESFFC
jgi:hypothetical protein